MEERCVKREQLKKHGNNIREIELVNLCVCVYAEMDRTMLMVILVLSASYSDRKVHQM